MSVINKQVLVLNTSYEPINITRVRRAVTLVFLGKAQIEEIDLKGLRVGNKIYKTPSVIRLIEYRHIPNHRRVLSKENIFIRDKYTCQYCERVFSKKHANKFLTLDHVIPKSRGGERTWTNLVTCCLSCNHYKDNKTLEEAQLILLNRPKEISTYTQRELLRLSGEENPLWKKYLYYDSKGTK